MIENCYPFVVHERDQKYHSPARGKVIVVCPTEELHEIGARMVVDFFTLCGYTTTFIGANTPQDEIVSAIQVLKPVYIAISITNYYNLIAARNAVELICDQKGRFILKLFWAVWPAGIIRKSAVKWEPIWFSIPLKKSINWEANRMLPFKLAVRFLKSGRGQTILIVIGIGIAIAAQIFIGLLITSLQKTLVNRTVGNQPQVEITSAADSPLIQIIKYWSAVSTTAGWLKLPRSRPPVMLLFKKAARTRLFWCAAWIRRRMVFTASPVYLSGSEPLPNGTVPDRQRIAGKIQLSDRSEPHSHPSVRGQS